MHQLWPLNRIPRRAQSVPDSCGNTRKPKRICCRDLILVFSGRRHVHRGDHLGRLLHVRCRRRHRRIWPGLAHSGRHGDYFVELADHYSWHFVRTAMDFLVRSGFFACSFALHNNAARYFYSLGRDGIVPHALGRTHQVQATAHRRRRSGCYRDHHRRPFALGCATERKRHRQLWRIDLVRATPNHSPVPTTGCDYGVRAQAVRAGTKPIVTKPKPLPPSSPSSRAHRSSTRSDRVGRRQHSREGSSR
jgi:hypothetical protein